VSLQHAYNKFVKTQRGEIGPYWIELAKQVTADHDGDPLETIRTGLSMTWIRYKFALEAVLDEGFGSMSDYVQGLILDDHLRREWLKAMKEAGARAALEAAKEQLPPAGQPPLGQPPGRT